MGGRNLSSMATIGIIAAVVIVVAIVGYVVWSHSGTPEPTVPPDQTLHNPFGNTPPSGRGGMAPAGPQTPSVPAPGTVDPTRGFGPSPGGPFRRR